MTDASAVILRPALPRDGVFLSDVYISTRLDELVATGWPAARRRTFLQQQYTARECAYRERFPEAKRSVVLLHKTPVGGFIVNYGVSEIRLVDIALLPAYRGRGIGTHLFAALFEEAAKQDVPLRLSVIRSNPVAGWYSRLGFAPLSEGGDYLSMEWTTPRAR
jgi:ribosomal protein S18 acetylase RimI-like enzyme